MESVTSPIASDLLTAFQNLEEFPLATPDPIPLGNVASVANVESAVRYKRGIHSMVDLGAASISDEAEADSYEALTIISNKRAKVGSMVAPTIAAVQNDQVLNAIAALGDRLDNRLAALSRNALARHRNSMCKDAGDALCPVVREVGPTQQHNFAIGSTPDSFPVTFGDIGQLTANQLNALGEFYEMEFGGATVALRRVEFRVFIGVRKVSRKVWE